MDSQFRMPLDTARIRPRRLSDNPWTSHPMGGYGKDVRGPGTIHQGWDLSALPGSQIYAIADGKIVEVQHHDLFPTAKTKDEKKSRAYGRTVMLEFDVEMNGVYIKRYAFYAHLLLVLVKEGQRVARGDVLGMTGTSGNAKNEPPHLHFEIRTQRRAPGLTGRVDPGDVLGYSVYSCQL